MKHVNLTVPCGRTIALVGQSGSGKSTLVDLLPRYHDVQQGEILIDGTNIKDVRIRDLRALIGNVNQEAILFNDTFFNNIAFGVEGATMEQVIAAAKIANAHDFIMETPECPLAHRQFSGLHSVLSQKHSFSFAVMVITLNFSPCSFNMEKASSATVLVMVFAVR